MPRVWVVEPESGLVYSNPQKRVSAANTPEQNASGDETRRNECATVATCCVYSFILRARAYPPCYGTTYEERCVELEGG